MLITIAILLRIIAGAEYMRAVLTNKAQPHIVSWFFWGLTALIAFGIQLSAGVGAVAYVTLALGIGPVLVCILAISKGHHRIAFTRIDKWCAGLTVLGITLWVITKNPLTALWMSVLADLISSVPTIIKCYQRPQTEHAIPYALSVVSMIITLISIHVWTLSTALFPAYILCINLTFTVLITSKIGLRPQGWQLQAVQLDRLTSTPTAPIEE